MMKMVTVYQDRFRRPPSFTLSARASKAERRGGQGEEEVVEEGRAQAHRSANEKGTVNGGRGKE